MKEALFPQQIRVRVEDDNSAEGYAYSSAFLIHSNIAILSFGDFIELYKIQQENGEEVYEMVVMLAPFEFRNKQELDFDQMVHDAAILSFGTFGDRYIGAFC